MTPRQYGPGSADRTTPDGAGDGAAGVLAVRTRVVRIYVDRTNQHWVVRDGDGRLWELPATDNPWVDRRPYDSGDDTDLEPVPGHYRDLLGLPH